MSMKQGKQFMKIIMLVLAIMVASYILYNVVQAGSSGIPTVRAVMYATSEGVTTEGFLVRQEEVIPAAYSLVLPTRSEGEKVTVGSEVAVSLRSADAQTRYEEVTKKEAELQQLQMALSYQTQLTDSDAVAERIRDTAAEFAVRVSQDRLDSASQTGQTLKSLALRQLVGGSDTTALQNQITRLKSELDQLETRSAADTRSITASKSGYYSPEADGYETLLTPEILTDITLEDFQSLWEKEVSPPSQAAGRLIDSPQWYYAAIVDKQYLTKVEVGDRLTVALGGEVNRELEMTVSRVNRSEEDQALLVLTSDQRLSDIAGLRRLKADVIFHAYSGLRVPKEAVCYNEETGSAGVYVLVNSKAVWKDIQLLYDSGDTYIAALDKSSTGNLWPDDLILLRTQGLFDGKVVE